MTKKKGWLALSVGAVAGFLTGILTAPKSGKETRQDIKEVASKAAHETEERLKLLYKSSSKQIKILEGKIKKVSGKSKKEMVEIREHFEMVRKKIKDLLSDLHDGLAESDDTEKTIREAEALERKARRVGPN